MTKMDTTVSRMAYLELEQAFREVREWNKTSVLCDGSIRSLASIQHEEIGTPISLALTLVANRICYEIAERQVSV